MKRIYLLLIGVLVLFSWNSRAIAANFPGGMTLYFTTDPEQPAQNKWPQDGTRNVKVKFTTGGGSSVELMQPVSTYFYKTVVPAGGCVTVEFMQGWANELDNIEGGSYPKTGSLSYDGTNNWVKLIWFTGENYWDFYDDGSTPPVSFAAGSKVYLNVAWDLYSKATIDTWNKDGAVIKARFFTVSPSKEQTVPMTFLNRELFEVTVPDDGFEKIEFLRRGPSDEDWGKGNPALAYDPAKNRAWLNGSYNDDWLDFYTPPATAFPAGMTLYLSTIPASGDWKADNASFHAVFTGGGDTEQVELMTPVSYNSDLCKVEVPAGTWKYVQILRTSDYLSHRTSVMIYEAGMNQINIGSDWNWDSYWAVHTPPPPPITRIQDHNFFPIVANFEEGIGGISATIIPIGPGITSHTTTATNPNKTGINRTDKVAHITTGSSSDNNWMHGFYLLFEKPFTVTATNRYLHIHLRANNMKLIEFGVNWKDGGEPDANPYQTGVESVWWEYRVWDLNGEVDHVLDLVHLQLDNKVIKYVRFCINPAEGGGGNQNKNLYVDELYVSSSATPRTNIPAYSPFAANCKWTGTAGDGDWNNSANWLNNVPPFEHSDVLIPAGFGNYPVLNDSKPYYSPVKDDITYNDAKNVTIEQGASIELAASSLSAQKIIAKTVMDSEQWYSIGFPFDVSAYAFDFDAEEVMTSGVNYWLKDFDGAGFNAISPNTDLIEEGKGYIFALPSGFGSATNISFVSSPIDKVTKGELDFSAANGVYVLQGNPTLADYTLALDPDQYVYQLSGDGIRYNRITSGTIAPFESVVTVTEINSPALKVAFSIDEITGMDNNPLNREAVVSTVYYNLQGQKVAQPQSGQVYIVKSIHESGTTSVVKQIK